MNMTHPLLCIYHANCLDGFTAAWAVWRRFPDTEFYAGYYNETPPDCTGRDVVMVDFSYKRPQLLEIAAKAKSVLILDHHKSAQAELVDLPTNVITEFDMDRSGAMMAWNHYHPDKEPTILIDHVQDRDLWRFELEDTKPFCAALFLEGRDFGVWDCINDFCAPKTDKQNEDYREFVRDGKLIEWKHTKDVQSLIDAAATHMELEGYNVPSLNAPFMFASEAGNIMAQGEPFSIIWYETGRHRIFSLRSDENGVDVSEIAQAFGGGGHRHAAGFKLRKLDFYPHHE